MMEVDSSGHKEAKADLNDVYRPDEDPLLRGALGGTNVSSDILVFDDAAAPSTADTAALLFGDDAARPDAPVNSSPAADLLGINEPQASGGASLTEVAGTDLLNLNPAPTAATSSAEVVFGDAGAKPAGPGAGPGHGGGRVAGHVRVGSAMSIIDLGDDGGSLDPGPVAKPTAEKKQGGILDDLPPGVTAEEYRQTVIDLSVAAPAEAAASAGSVVGSTGNGADGAGGGGVIAALGLAAPAGDAPANRKPRVDDFKNAQGFGSDDLFGNEKSKVDQVLDMLPQPVKDQLQAANCVNGVASTVVADDEVGDQPNRPGAQGTSALALADLEAQQRQQALQRAMEGQWVPTYMRQQLSEHGHTALPPGSAPNAHEYDARTGPPTTETSFAEVAEDLQETTRNMLNFVWVVLSSLAFQCQVCTHHSASVAHEQVVAFGENLCTEVRNVAPCEETLDPLVDESSGAYGPMRSRARRCMQGVTFKQLLDVVRLKLVTPVAPPEFLRAVTSRKLVRQQVDTSAGTEDLIFHVEVAPNVLPQEAMQHVWPLTCRERWHIRTREYRACIEVTNDPCSGPVAVVLRIDIDGTCEGGCEVDSRLYARPQEHGAVLPRGLVEQLFEAHHQYSENLRDVTLALVAGGSATTSGGQGATLPPIGPIGAVFGQPAATHSDGVAPAPVPVVQGPS